MEAIFCKDERWNRRGPIILLQRWNLEAENRHAALDRPAKVFGSFAAGGGSYAYDMLWSRAEQGGMGIVRGRDGSVGIGWRTLCAKWIVNWTMGWEDRMAPLREREEKEVVETDVLEEEGAFGFGEWVLALFEERGCGAV